MKRVQDEYFELGWCSSAFGVQVLLLVPLDHE